MLLYETMSAEIKDCVKTRKKVFKSYCLQMLSLHCDLSPQSNKMQQQGKMVEEAEQEKQQQATVLSC